MRSLAMLASLSAELAQALCCRRKKSPQGRNLQGGIPPCEEGRRDSGKNFENYVLHGSSL